MSTTVSAEEIPELAIAMSVEPSGARLALSGDLEFATIADFEAALHRVAEEHPDLPVTLDLQQLDFMDSSGIGALLNANAAVGGRGVALTLIRGPQRVHRPLEVSGVDRLLPFADPA